MKQKMRLSKKRILSLMGLTICLFMIFQITITAQDQASRFVGKWERIINGSTMTLSFDAEKNYKVDFNSDGNIEVFGSFVIENDTITFNDKPGGYAVREPGVYTFLVEKGNVTFTIVDDPSDGRSGLLAGTWTKAQD